MNTRWTFLVLSITCIVFFAASGYLCYKWFKSVPDSRPQPEVGPPRVRQSIPVLPCASPM